LGVVQNRCLPSLQILTRSRHPQMPVLSCQAASEDAFSAKICKDVRTPK
jgi:hypothetical protein